MIWFRIFGGREIEFGDSKLFKKKISSLVFFEMLKPKFTELKKIKKVRHEDQFVSAWTSVVHLDSSVVSAGETR